MSSREDIKNREGIMLTDALGAITASTSIFPDYYERSPFSKYAPYEAVHIFNNSASLIWVYVNQNAEQVHPIAGKTEKTIEGISLWSLRVAEKSAANITAGDVVIIVEKVGATADTFVKRLTKRFGWL